MNYSYVLSDDDLYTLCELISAKKIKGFYKNNTRWFGTIKPGFRPTGISDKEAIALVIRNRNELIVRAYIDTIVDKWISLIEEEIKQKESEGLDKDHALGTVLSKSKFSENIDLYFKLKKDSVSEDYLQRIRSYMPDNDETSIPKDGGIADEVQKEASESGTHQGYDLSNAELEGSIRAQKEINASIKADLEKLEQQNSELQKKLNEANVKANTLELSVQKCKEELNEYKARLEYDDSEIVNTATSTEYDHISLCEVTVPDYKGNRYLYRLADIDLQGRLQKFESDVSRPFAFDNRDKLYYLDGTSAPGTVAVWNWSAVPKANDPSKDYLKRDYNNLISPIEVITYKECDTIEKLLNLLKAGVPNTITTERVLLAIAYSKGQSTGLLCRRSYLNESDGRTILSERVINLPEYEFSIGDVVKLNNEKYYYRKINIGVPSEIIRVKSSLDIVRTILLARSTWPLFKEKGKTRNEWKNVRDFLDGLEKETVLDSISEQAHCSHDEAIVMLEEFIDYAESYIDGTTIEDDIIAAVISVNDDLKNKCKKLLTEEWEAENREAIIKAEGKLNDLQDQIASVQKKYTLQLEEGKRKIEDQQSKSKADLKKLVEEHDYLVSENTKLKASIETRESLAADVEAKVSERISKAQTDAAEFIASMAFTFPNLHIPTITEKDEHVSEREEVIEVQVPDTVKITYYPGTVLNSDDLEESNSWNDTLDIIALELEDAGVDSNYARSLGAYLYSAYMAKVPVFLIGPNGKEIADAFCGALFGRRAGLLECVDTYSIETVEECYLSEDNIITIVNPFSPSWISRIPDITSNRSKYFFVIYPFEEDIQIEPRSLYTYLLPLLTSLFVVKNSTDTPVGGLMSNHFKDYAMTESNKCHEKTLTSLRTPLIVKNRIQYILGNMHSMLNDKNVDYDVLYSILPYAFATMQMPTLMSAISEPDKTLRISNDLAKNITSLFGEFE